MLTLSTADVEIFPAFNYALDEHTTEILLPEHPPGCRESKTVTFSSKDLKLQLDVTIDHGEEDSESCPAVTFRKETKSGMRGPGKTTTRDRISRAPSCRVSALTSPGVVAHIHLVEGQAISFVLRDDIPNHVTPDVTTDVLDHQQHDTQTFWFNWISKSRYKGRWREVVSRSLLILKLLTFEPTGAIIAAPTFSIPEDIGGTRYVRSGAGLASTDDLRAQKLGLSFLLGARLEFHHLHSPPHGLHRRGRCVHGVYQ